MREDPHRVPCSFRSGMDELDYRDICPNLKPKGSKPPDREPWLSGCRGWTGGNGRQDPMGGGRSWLARLPESLCVPGKTRPDTPREPGRNREASERPACG